uniref:Uncharacterized protein n=1 Tax=Cacopsylla melanoneura TaxID=428564 RepID=A0A8D8QRD5_9HEMI
MPSTGSRVWKIMCPARKVMMMLTIRLQRATIGRTNMETNNKTTMETRTRARHLVEEITNSNKTTDSTSPPFKVHQSSPPTPCSVSRHRLQRHLSATEDDSPRVRIPEERRIKRKNTHTRMKIPSLKDPDSRIRIPTQSRLLRPMLSRPRRPVFTSSNCRDHPVVGNTRPPPNLASPSAALMNLTTPP